MAYVYDLNYGDQDPPDLGYSLGAQLQYGDNGPANGGDPELYLGDSSGDGSDGRNQWFSSTADDGESDSGYVPVELTVGPTASQLAVGASPDTPTYSGLGGTDIGDVILEAHVGVNAAVQWSDIKITFRYDGQVVDSYAADVGPGVDTRDTDGSATDTTGLEVVPQHPANSVTVDASLQFILAAGTYPGPTDVMGAILVTTPGSP